MVILIHMLFSDLDANVLVIKATFEGINSHFQVIRNNTYYPGTNNVLHGVIVNVLFLCCSVGD